MWKPSARGWGAVVAIVALLAVPSVPASAAPSGGSSAPSALVRDEDYPTQEEVDAAKQNEQSKQDEVANITALLDSLESQSAELADAALQRGLEYQQASDALQTATGYADSLSAQATAATEKSQQANTQVGRLAAQLYRSGGDSTLNLVLNQGDADSLLYQLGAMSKITEQTGRIRAAAVAAENTAKALTEQAETAKAERDRLAQEAQARLQAAEDAQAAMQAQLAEEKSHSDTLVAQLATLKDTSAAVESARRAGLAAEAEQRAREAAAAAAAAAAAIAAGGDPGPSDIWVPGGDQIMTPGQAQAYASSIMGSYGWGGDQFSCLVQLWNGESGWRANALNESSGAYGIPQSLPASKMASVGSDYITNAATQIIWGMNYIAGRYDTPCGAWSAWLARSPHWY